MQWLQKDAGMAALSDLMKCMTLPRKGLPSADRASQISKCITRQNETLIVKEHHLSQLIKFHVTAGTEEHALLADRQTVFQPVYPVLQKSLCIRRQKKSAHRPSLSVLGCPSKMLVFTLAPCWNQSWVSPT